MVATNRKRPVAVDMPGDIAARSARCTKGWSDGVEVAWRYRARAGGPDALRLRLARGDDARRARKCRYFTARRELHGGPDGAPPVAAPAPPPLRSGQGGAFAQS